VTLSDAAAVNPSFVTPPVDLDGTTLTFDLTVSDSGGLKHIDEITIVIHDNGIDFFPVNVITMMSTTGEPIGIEVNGGGSSTSLTAVDPSSTPETPDKPENLPYGLFDMQIKVYGPTDTVKVDIYLPTPAPDGYKWYKYSSTSGWYDYSNNAVFSAGRDKITLTLVDGGAGDDDGSRNGIIWDPSGLGVFPATGGGGGSSSSASGGGGGGCFIATATIGTEEDTDLHRRIPAGSQK
jgi:hypothetical protein